MNLVMILLGLGLVTGLLVVAFFVLFERRRRRAGPLNAPGLPGQHTIAQIGQNAAPQMSLDAVVMRPTIGLRLASFATSCFILWAIWGPVVQNGAAEQWLAVGLTAVTIYLGAYVAFYEARFDGEALVAPDWFLFERRYAWTDFEAIQLDGRMLFVLTFAGKKMQLQRYLVGMPTLLTFLEDVKNASQET